MVSKRTHRSRYGRYVGGPDPLAPPVDLSEALDAIGEDVMSGYSPEHAMREFLRRGGRDQQGLDELARQVAQKRREMLAKHNLDGTFAEIKQLLDKAVLSERKRLARDLDDDARFAEMRIENLSPSTAAAVNELGDYPWRDVEAREDYERIKDLLGREMLDQRFAGMKKALEGATEEDRAGVAEMLKDLNSLLAQHRAGQNTDSAFEQFMDKHGDFFPERPETMDELLDALAQRAAAAQRMRNSMTQEQRDELDALAAQAFGSPELMDQLGALDDNLRALRPGEDWSGGEQFEGEQGMGLGDGTGMLQDLADLDALGEQLSQQYAGAQMDDLDLDALRRQLGDEAAIDAQRLAELDKQLRSRDYLQSDPQGDLRLSPRAMRELGRSLLRDVSQALSGRQGQRDARKAGTAGEPTGASRPWEFGDTESWDVTRTLTNATVRRAGEPGGPLISFEDVEVQETEARTQAAVALLVDTSFSMAMDGRWLPMKRTALALHQLISTRFRGDHLELVAFGRHARTMDIAELTGLAPEWEKGTNLHHALMLANGHFRRFPNAQPVLLIVTDGEPTSHLEADGEVFFDYPPHPLTVAYAVRELDTSVRLGAQTTIFRLGEDPGLARFLDQLAGRSGGRVQAPELDGLGAAVVDSYLSGRTSRGGWFGASG
ncbi:MAG: VWA domain-containing protein [Actinomycetota bacterium]|nr:VWA domain-containing protein [Actinomycetota bacterium]